MKPSPSPSERRAVFAVFITLVLDLAALSIIFPLYPAMLDWYLPSLAETGLLADLRDWMTEPTTPRLAVTAAFGGVMAGMFGLLQFFSARFWGALADRLGRRPVLLITVGGLLVAQLLWAFGASFWVFVLSRALAGLFAGNIGVATAVIADVTPLERRTRGMAWVGIAFALGFLVGPTLGGLSMLLDFEFSVESGAVWGLHPFSVPALGAAGLGAINLVWLWRALPETRPEKDDVIAADPPGTVAQGLWGRGSPAFRHISRLNFLLLFTLAAMEFCLTFLAVERLRFDPPALVSIFVVLSITLALVQGAFVRPFADKVGNFPLLVAGIWMIALSNVGLGVAQSAPTFFLALVGFACGIACFQPTLSALASRHTGAEHAARDLGAFRAAGSLGRALGPFAAAAAFYQFGSVITYGLGGALAMICALWALFLPRD